MPTTVTVYKNTDAGAPSLLSNAVPMPEATNFVNLYTKCLVDGYGTKPAAGWTKPYTGTNKAAFLPGGGNQLYLRVDDSTGTGSECYLVTNGYETMSDVDTGTGPFPVTGTLVNGAFSRSAVARPWVIVADNRTVYLFLDGADTLVYTATLFGDFYSYKSSDSYRTLHISPSTSAAGAQGFGFFTTGTLDTADPAHCVARSYTAGAGGITIGTHGDNLKKASGLSGVLPYPHTVDSKIWLSPLYLHETSGVVRGKYRGLWQWLHPTAGIADQDTWPGAGDLAGKTFLAIRDASISGNGVYVVETSSTWDTN